MKPAAVRPHETRPRWPAVVAAGLPVGGVIVGQTGIAAAGGETKIEASR